MSCMREIGEEKICPYCGYHVNSAQIPPYLPVRTVIANRYLVGKILEYNGEGATYIGWDLSEKKAVKIREFIPDSFTVRTSASPEAAEKMTVPITSPIYAISGNIHGRRA